VALTHGGQLSKVTQSLGLDTEDWLDLSTGISPFSYPIPLIPEAVWRELPEQKHSLLRAAQDYYAVKQLLVTSGSQAVIQKLPLLWDKKPASQTKVLVPEIGYKEHEKSWSDAGFEVERYQQLPGENQLYENCILIVINPNNPSGKKLELRCLRALQKQINKLNGWLIVDEAFIDVYPKSDSIMPFASDDGIFVLRSIGKFFGLAGIRVGFVSCHSYWLNKLDDLFGPWPVNGPALYIVEKALANESWQKAQRKRLSSSTTRLINLLMVSFPNSIESISGTDLFVTLKHPQAVKIFQTLCNQKIYIRLCDDKQAIRIGIPNNQDFKRFAEGLKMVLDEIIT